MMGHGLGVTDVAKIKSTAATMRSQAGKAGTGMTGGDVARIKSTAEQMGKKADGMKTEDVDRPRDPAAAQAGQRNALFGHGEPGTHGNRAEGRQAAGTMYGHGKKTPEQIQSTIQKGMLPLPKPSAVGELGRSAGELGGRAVRGLKAVGDAAGQAASAAKEGFKSMAPKSLGGQHGHGKMASYGTSFAKHAEFPDFERIKHEGRAIGESAMRGGKQIGEKLRGSAADIGGSALAGAGQAADYLKANPMAAAGAVGLTGLLGARAGLRGLGALARKVTGRKKKVPPGVIARLRQAMAGA
jgi:hypothetical protein